MTNPMPVDTTYGTVSFAAFQTAADTILDADALPQARPVPGTVRILRSVPVTLYQTAARPFTLFAGSHAYSILGGIMVDEEGRDSVTLVATTSPGGNPPGGPGVYYTATFDLIGVAQRPPVVFTLDAGQHVDLSQAAAVPSAPGPAGIVRGRSILIIDNPPGTTNLRISYDDGTVDTIPMPPGTSVTVVADGDRGDIIVSGAGTVWNIDAAIITPAARGVLAATTTAAMLTALGAVASTDPRLSDARTPLAHGHLTSDVAGLDAALTGKAPLASPTFTGTPAAPTVKLTGGIPAVGKVWTATGADGSGSWQAPTPGGGAGGSLADGDYGDIVVTGTGATLSLDTDVVTPAARTVLDDLTVAAMRATLGAVADADPRLADNRTPTAHTHGESDVAGLAADLDSKANAVTTGNSIAALQSADTAHDSAIAGKADAAANTTAHNTLQANIDTANAGIAGKAPLASPTFTGTPVLPSPRLTGGSPATGKVWTGVGASGDGAWTALPAQPTALPPPDGDKGDISVTAAGTVWTIDPGVITNAKLTNVATATLKGRSTAATGPPEDLTAAQARALLNVADGATANATDALLRDRATHTGAQTLDTTTDTGTRVAMTPAERTKLGGVATSATNNGPGIGVVDGDKGDVVVSVNGTIWNIDAAVISAAARTVLDDANITAMRATLDTYSTAQIDAADAGKQPLDPDLTAIAALTPTTDNFMVAAASAWASRTPAQAKTALALVKADVGLGNVDNTADVDKPVSTAQQAALDLKAAKNVLVLPVTAAYTLVLTDNGRAVQVTTAGAVAVTVPLNATEAFPVGATIEVAQMGPGQVTLTPAAGVTLRSRGGLLKTAGQYAAVSLRRTGTADEWLVVGDLAA